MYGYGGVRAGTCRWAVREGLRPSEENNNSFLPFWFQFGEMEWVGLQWVGRGVVVSLVAPHRTPWEIHWLNPGKVLLLNLIREKTGSFGNG